MTSPFECPYCTKKFLVSAKMAGTVVKCPHCEGVLELAALRDLTDERLTAGQASRHSGTVGESIGLPNGQKTTCPLCEGAFQATASMIDQAVACPHCMAHWRIMVVDGRAICQPLNPSDEGVIQHEPTDVVQIQQSSSPDASRLLAALEVTGDESPSGTGESATSRRRVQRNLVYWLVGTTLLIAAALLLR